MDTPLMNKSSFGSYVNVRKTFNFKRFPNPEVLNELKDDVRSLVSVEREGDVLKRIVLASYPGVTEHEVHKSVQHWCLNMARLSQKENIPLVQRGLAWKYLYLSVLYSNDLEESEMKEVLSLAGPLVQRCGEECAHLDDDPSRRRLMRLVYFSGMTVLTLCCRDDSILREFTQYCVVPYSSAPLYTSLSSAYHSATTLSFSSEQLASVVCSLGSSEWSVALASLLLGSYRLSSGTNSKQQEHLVEDVRRALHFVLAAWQSLDAATRLQPLCAQCFRSFLQNVALSRAALKELSHSSLFFHGILSFFGDDQASKRSRTDDAGETVAANCIVVVGDQAATKPRSLVNMLLLSLRALLSHPTANAESLHALLRCVVEVAWRQCRSHLPQPAAFSMERKRDKESRNAVSVPHFHILLLDLLQSVCCQL
ncbi:hypothetical protein WA538_003355, partial [Blastocystis sp. DL]